MACFRPNSSMLPALAALVAALAATSPLVAAIPASTVESQTSVTLVDIPVEVEDRGVPVTDLVASDFLVTEGASTLPIVGFERIELGGAGAPLPSPAARRYLFFLFDFTFSDARRILDGVAASRRLLSDGLDPSDLVAVAVHMPWGQLAVLSSFTADRAASDRVLGSIAAAIEGGGASREQAADPLRLGGGTLDLLTLRELTRGRNIFVETLDEYVNMGGLGGALIQDYLVSGANETAPDVQRVQDDQAGNLLDGVTQLLAALRGVDGRKMLLLFSQGFTMPEEAGTGLLTRLNRVVEELRHSGWALHAIDLTGTREEGGTGSAAFAFLAGPTGGSVVERTQDFAGGLRRSLEKSAHAYLLTVQVGDVAFDGAFHPLTVRLADPVRRAKLRHRDGYYAPLPFAARSSASRSFEASQWISGDEERDELGIEIATVRLPAAGGATRLAAVVEVPWSRLFSGDAMAVRSVEVLGYALDPSGVVLDTFGYSAELDPEKVGGRLADGGLRVLGDLALPAGESRLRVLVRDRVDGRLSLRTVRVPAGAPDAAPTFEALFLPGEGDPWIVVPATSSGFDLRGRSFVPAAQATLPARGEAELFLVGSGISAPGTDLQGTIVGADGRPGAAGGVEVLAVSPGTPGDGTPDVIVARLHAGDLPPGRYLLELRASGGARAASAVRPFEVRP